MVSVPEEPFGLPQAPPPRPAARQQAIEAALRKFDGLEPAAPFEAGRRQPRRFGWATRHQRAAGAFATAALVLIVTVPLGLRTIEQGRPTSATHEVSSPAQPSFEVADSSPGTPTGTAAAPPSPVQAERAEPVQGSETPAAPRPLPAPLSPGVAVAQTSDDVAGQVTPPAFAPAPPAPPPPPPPPPPPTSVQTAESGVALAEKVASGEVVVTGSRVRTPSAAPSAVQSSPLAVIGAKDSLLTEFQSALRSGNREKVLQLIGLPLKVRYAGRTVTYRRAADVRRDFERIFTPAVEASFLHGQTASQDLRPGQTVTIGRLTIRMTCRNKECSATSSSQIIAVTPD